MNIFETLRADHDRQRAMLDELVETHGDTAERDEIFRRVKRELHDHAAAEERCFYIPLMESDLTQDKARHGVAEHHEIDELVEKLQETPHDSPGWLAHAKHLRELVNHDLDDEEHGVFQMAGKVLSEKSKTELAGEFRGERERLEAIKISK